MAATAARCTHTAPAAALPDEVIMNVTLSDTARLTNKLQRLLSARALCVSMFRESVMRATDAADVFPAVEQDHDCQLFICHSGHIRCNLIYSILIVT